ncbi:hypothetical protein Tco_1166706 [Tanacetum coccineum]
MGLWYSKDTDMSLTVYSDADHTGCQDTRRNTSEALIPRGEEDERELFEIKEVGVFLFSGGEGEDDIENLKRSERFRSEEERMGWTKENRVKVAEKEETGKFHGSPDGGPANLKRYREDKTCPFRGVAKKVDPDDHLRNLQHSLPPLKTGHNPLWCHMFNSTAFRLNLLKGKVVPRTLLSLVSKTEIAKGSPQASTRSAIRTNAYTSLREAAAATAEKATQQQGTRTIQEQSNDQSSSRNNSYRGQRRRGNDKYTPLTMTPKEILATEGSNSQTTSDAHNPDEQRVGNGTSEYHSQKVILPTNGCPTPAS